MTHTAGVLGCFGLFLMMGCHNGSTNLPAAAGNEGATMRVEASQGELGVPSRPGEALQPAPAGRAAHGGYLGFDRNDYPGDAAWTGIAKQFAFTGYWLNNPPGANANGWMGKRAVVRASGLGFLILFNGRLDKEILAAQKRGQTPDALGKADAALAVKAAARENFPKGAILYLDQEEGGRMLPEQAGYLLAWTEAVAASGYKPGVYASGKPVEDEPGKTITTAQDIQQQVKAKRLHEIALFVAQDACPPANGCSAVPPAMKESGTPGAIAWQYAQSPREPEITRSCAKTYNADGNCYVAGFPGMFVDLDVSSEADPSKGR